MKICKSILFGLIAVIILSTAPAMASGGKPKEAAKSGPKTFGTKAISAGSESFLQFYPSAATVFSGYKPAGLMHFEYGLNIENSAVRERAVKLAPRLRDAYGRVLAQYAGSLYSPGEVPDMEYLVSRMQGITDRMIGKGNARFLVSTLMVRD